MKQGDLVRVTIEDVFAFGAFARLPEGERAYIRKRELSRDKRVSPPNVVQQGDRVEAIVLSEAGPGKLLELSVREALGDPWPKFVAGLKRGSVVEAEVVELSPGGAYVQILPGVDGFVPLSEFALWEVRNASSMFWLGDQIQAIVVGLSDRTRLLRLSIKDRLRDLCTNSVLALRLSQAHGEAEYVTEGRQRNTTCPMELAAITPAQKQAFGAVLVVENDDGVRENLVDWLDGQGWTAHGASTPDAAQRVVQSIPVRVMLVDLHLDETDGLTLLRHLRDVGATPIVAVMSLPEWIEKQFADIVALGVVEAFAKPLDVEEVAGFLGHALLNGPPQALVVGPVGGEATRALGGDTRGLPTTSSAAAARIRSTLADVRRATGADTACLFRIDRASCVSSVLARDPADASAISTYRLHESPVGDVIFRDQPMLVDDASLQEDKCRNLRDVIPFRSCIGLPVHAGDELEHALFILHSERHRFGDDALHMAHATATLLSAFLEQQVFYERLARSAETFVEGELSAGLVHELANKITPLELRLRSMLSTDSQPAAQPVAAPAFAHVLRLVEDLRDTVMLFAEARGAGKLELTDVNQVVDRVVALVNPTAKDERVRVRVVRDDAIPSVRMEAIALQQALLNIVLNAVQHTALKPTADTRRLVEIAPSYHASESLPIRVAVTDTGPGIHAAVQERVFQLGFTTRANGSGMGLRIARDLIEAAGGRIRVDSSLIPLGTRFLIMLPQIDDSK